MDAFKRYAKAETLLALCLTAASETHHHWSVFAPGTDGVRIVLDEEKLKQVTGDGSGVTMRDVEYRTIEKMGKHPLLPSDLPFIKRYPYRGEEEVRLLFHSSECFRFHSIKLLEGTIREVALSPRLPEAFSDDMKAAIQAAAEKSDAGTPRVYRSTLLENNDWIKFAKKFEVPDN
ncbi:hypothetical protein [Maricaulis parjimensis]|uniref:hypothetical protein n=1 Tax=Maricaulis parjimensis TaxID=144023 RepID=UPI001EED144E|nr:hypothetical protein [Maricaulis parjimensis]